MDFAEIKPTLDDTIIENITENNNEEPFNFPFPPYPIQKKLMEVAYDVYSNSEFGILESPTGTGKSLSLICSSLTWLRDHQRRVKLELETKKQEMLDKVEQFKREEEESNDWLSVQSKRQDVNRELDKINRELDRILKFELKDEARWHAKVHGKSFDDYDALNKMVNNNHKNKRESGLLVSTKDKHNVDLDLSKTFCATNSSQESIARSQPTTTLPNGYEYEVEGEDDMEKKINKQLEEEDHIKPKIYYASRTHSQLSQFIGEIKRTIFADSIKGPPIKVAPIASRANLCVNPEVMKFKESSAINERCIEMQRETNKDKRCPYIKGKQVNLLKEEILSSVQDIEDIVKSGVTLGACPYYASRLAVPEAEVVVLPYNNLFHNDTRKASSLNLSESIVIVDEAHNILETICSIHSAQISGLQLISTHTILSRYYLKFKGRFSPKNAEMIRAIIQCLTSLIRYLNDPKSHLADYDNSKMVNVNEVISTLNEDKKLSSVQTLHQEELMIDVMKFICTSKIEKFNVFKMIDYFSRSQLARKLIGFFRQDQSLDLSLEILEHPKTSVLTSDRKTIKTKSRGKQQQGPNKRRKIIAGSEGGAEAASALSIGEQTMSTPTRDSNKNENKLVNNPHETTNLNFLLPSNESLAKLDSKDLAYPIYNLVEFFKSLTSNLEQDGKICTDYHPGKVEQSQLKYILLNPSSQFKQMTQEARSIVLVGGTMQPFSEFIELLFKPLSIAESRIKVFSCDHVIPEEQLYVSTLYNGSSGKPLELSYKTRANFEFIDEIGRTILNLTNVVPGGMVCFLPSYEYEQFCFKRWTQIGLIGSIERKSKQVFREPRQANQLKLIWEQYTRVVEKGRTSGRGAILFCVVGGKMSEGINFNDDLGRCVVMIGLPYANIKSGELKQKMDYYDRTCKCMSNLSQRQQGNTSGCRQLSAGQQYYENLCIKGINQSIGRAIRHRKDYASIILLDRRYSSKANIRKGLPAWLRKSLLDHERFGPMLAELRSFFNSLSSKQL